MVLGVIYIITIIFISLDHMWLVDYASVCVVEWRGDLI